MSLIEQAAKRLEQLRKAGVEVQSPVPALRSAAQPQAWNGDAANGCGPSPVPGIPTQGCGVGGDRRCERRSGGVPPGSTSI
jgi:hypothetical protein